jgi:hypothetical protein
MTKIFILSLACRPACFERDLLFDEGGIGLSMQALRLLHRSFRTSITALWNSKSKLCYDRWSVSLSVMVSSTSLGLKTRYISLSDCCRLAHVGRRTSWELDVITIIQVVAAQVMRYTCRLI